MAKNAAGALSTRVLLGMSATELNNSNLQFPTALGIVNQPVYERRRFTPGVITAATMNSWLDAMATAGQYGVISFKVPKQAGDDKYTNAWAAAANGAYDSKLDIAVSVANSRRAAGKPPWALAIHHEPSSDGDFATWADMQTHFSIYLADRGTQDIMAFTAIANGFVWGPNRYTNGGGAADAAAMFPSSLITTFNNNKSIIACDCYDGTTDTTAEKIQGFTEWCIARNVNNLGLGEFGCSSGTSLTASWNYIKSRVDRFVYANYFNSGQNSDSDWRLIPNGYPPDPAVTGYSDGGGTSTSEARLVAFRAALTDSLAGGTPGPLPDPGTDPPQDPGDTGGSGGTGGGGGGGSGTVSTTTVIKVWPTGLTFNDDTAGPGPDKPGVLVGAASLDAIMRDESDDSYWTNDGPWTGTGPGGECEINGTWEQTTLPSGQITKIEVFIRVSNESTNGNEVSFDASADFFHLGTAPLFVTGVSAHNGDDELVPADGGVIHQYDGASGDGWNDDLVEGDPETFSDWNEDYFRQLLANGVASDDDFIGAGFQITRNSSGDTPGVFGTEARVYAGWMEITVERTGDGPTVWHSAGNVLQEFSYDGIDGLTYVNEYSPVDPNSNDTPTALTQTRYRGGATVSTGPDAGNVVALQEPTAPVANHKSWGAMFAPGLTSPNLTWGEPQFVRNTGANINASTAAWVTPYLVGALGEQLWTVALTQAQLINSTGTYAHMIVVDTSGAYGQHQFIDNSADLFYFKNALPCYDDTTGITYYVRGNLTSAVTVGSTSYTGAHEWEVWAFDPTFTYGDETGNYFVASAASLGDEDFFPDSLGGHLDADGNIVALGNIGHITIFTPSGDLVYKMTTPDTAVYEEVYSYNDAAVAALTPAFANAYEPGGFDHAAVSPDGLCLLLLGDRHDVSGSTPTATYGTERARAGFFDAAVWRWSITDRALINEEPFPLPGFTNSEASSPVPARAQAIWSIFPPVHCCGKLKIETLVNKWVMVGRSVCDCGDADFTTAPGDTTDPSPTSPGVPANDTPSDAQVITVPSGGTVTTPDTGMAGSATDEVVDGETVYNGVWYSYTAGGSGSATFTTDDSSNLIKIYTGTPSSLVPFADGTGTVTATVVSGTTYLILLGYAVDTPLGTYELTIVGPASPIPPPINDLASGAIAISTPGGTGQSTLTNHVGATNDGTVTGGIWFTYTPAASGSATFSAETT